MTESTDQETPKCLYIIRWAIAIRVILSWLDNDVKWEHFQLNGELWECGICTLLVLSKNKINFETPLKNTTSSVIIYLKICDSAEKLNLEKLNFKPKTSLLNARLFKLKSNNFLWFLKVWLCVHSFFGSAYYEVLKTQSQNLTNPNSVHEEGKVVIL